MTPIPFTDYHRYRAVVTPPSRIHELCDYIVERISEPCALSLRDSFLVVEREEMNGGFFVTADVQVIVDELERRLMPKRIQRKRTKGWRMPEGAVYVGRPSIWGNPFAAWQEGPLGRCPIDNEGATWFFGDMFKHPEFMAVTGYPTPEQIREELAGKTLACWCEEGSHCHGDVLIRMANAHTFDALRAVVRERQS